MQGWIVICLLGEQEDPENAGYVLATRTVFRTRQSAERYAKTVAEDRKAIVVYCFNGVDFREAGARWYQ